MKTYDRAISFYNNGWMYDDMAYEKGDSFELYSKRNLMNMVFDSNDEISHDKELELYNSYCVLIEEDMGGITSQWYVILPGKEVKKYVKSIKKIIECDGKAYYIFDMRDGRLI